MTDSNTALLLEDDDFDAAVTREILEKCCRRRYAVHRCKFLSEAIVQLSRHDYPVALVDMNVLDSKGLDTVRGILQANPSTPIIILTGTDDDKIAVEALEMGAQDYLPKSGLDSRALERVIQHSIRRKAKENELTVKAYHDTLTGLGNRALLYERWRRSQSRSRRADRKTGVLVLDVDSFKAINDSYGHEAGDLLLQDVSEKLRNSVRDTDIVARLGGDEFVVVLENVPSKSEINIVRDKLMNKEYSFALDDLSINYTLSIGGAISDPDDEEDLMSVLRRADIEMYEFKAKPKTNAALPGETRHLAERRARA